MKKIAIINVLLLALLWSCEDAFLDKDHPTQITDDDFWQTFKDVNSALGILYNQVPFGAYQTTNTPYVGNVVMEGMTDNSFHSGSFFGNIRTWSNGTLTPTDGGILRTWNEYYKVIRKCSRFIDNIHRPFIQDEQIRDAMKGEALVLRAFYNMQLLKYFGNDVGIPVVTEVLEHPTGVALPRNSLEESIELINGDLDSALSLSGFPDVPDQAEAWRASKALAYSLKAKLYLQVKDYEKARDAAKAVIDLNHFELYRNPNNTNNYRDLFRYAGQVNNERIFYDPTGNKEAWFRNALQSIGGRAGESPTASLVNAYETLDGRTIEETGEAEEFRKNPNYQPRDPRLTATVQVPGRRFAGKDFDPFTPSSPDYYAKKNTPKTGYNLIKFLDGKDRGRPWQGNLDFMVIRYAEILLVYVEALIENGQYDHPDVVLHLNDIRNRAGMPNVDETVYNTQGKLRELLRRERRVELAFEGQRFLDLRRWGIAEQQMAGPVMGAYNTLTGEYLNADNRIFTEPRNLNLPIPQTELDANPNISPNPGW